MSALVGKWQLYSSENFEEYMQAIGVSAEMVAKAKTALSDRSKLTHEIQQDGDQWVMKTSTPMGEKEIKFKLGEEFQTTTLDGRSVKVVMSLEGNKLTDIQTGDGFQSRNVRTVNGDEMIGTLTGGGVTATRKYKRV